MSLNKGTWSILNWCVLTKRLGCPCAKLVMRRDEHSINCPEFFCSIHPAWCSALMHQALDMQYASKVKLFIYHQHSITFHGKVPNSMTGFGSSCFMSEVFRRFVLLDVVVAQGSSIFELLASKNQALLVGWDTFCGKLWRATAHSKWGVAAFKIM